MQKLQPNRSERKRPWEKVYRSVVQRVYEKYYLPVVYMFIIVFWVLGTIPWHHGISQLIQFAFVFGCVRWFVSRLLFIILFSITI